MEKYSVHTGECTNGLMSTLGLVVTSIRPLEWTKNILLFAALFFSKNLLNVELLTKTLMAFGVFCLATGGIYLVNDIYDCDQDKKHPQKSSRPIASGRLPIALAARAAVVLLIISLSTAFVINVAFGLATTMYAVLNIAYSKWLKHAVILDVFSIAAGFVLRVVAGALVIDVTMSHWLLICTMLLALFLGFTKRRFELITLGNDASVHRQVLSEYNPLFLDMMVGISTSSTLVMYILYTVSDETVARFSTDKLFVTVPFVLYGILRYLYLVYHKHKGGNPAHDLYADRPLLMTILLWKIFGALIIYG